jgi:hypothetical protein
MNRYFGSLCHWWEFSVKPLNAWKFFSPGTIRTPVSRFQERLRRGIPGRDLWEKARIPCRCCREQRQARGGGSNPHSRLYPWKVPHSSLWSSSRGVIFFRFNLLFFGLRCGLSKLFQRHTVGVSAPLATYIVVVPSALFKSFKSELDFLGLNGKAPITSVTSDLHE